MKIAITILFFLISIFQFPSFASPHHTFNFTLYNDQSVPIPDQCLQSRANAFADCGKLVNNYPECETSCKKIGVACKHKCWRTKNPSLFNKCSKDIKGFDTCCSLISPYQNYNLNATQYDSFCYFCGLDSIEKFSQKICGFAPKDLVTGTNRSLEAIRSQINLKAKAYLQNLKIKLLKRPPLNEQEKSKIKKIIQFSQHYFNHYNANTPQHTVN